eukprot:1161044-Pelagomonas_calceolata.AAC.3
MYQVLPTSAPTTFAQLTSLTIHVVATTQDVPSAANQRPRVACSGGHLRELRQTPMPLSTRLFPCSNVQGHWHTIKTTLHNAVFMHRRLSGCTAPD